jgi:hypothetical protein
MGCCSLNNDQEKAEYYFQQAVDNDPLPVRATSQINTIIRELAKDEDVVFVDIENVFNEKYGIPGDEAFVSHVHPDLKGQGLIAFALMEGILKNDNISPTKDQWMRATGAIRVYLSGLPSDFYYESYYNAASASAVTGRFYRSKRLCERTQMFIEGENKEIPLKKYVEELSGQSIIIE